MNYNDAYEKKRKKMQKSDVIYRCIGDKIKNGIVACGFMRKETAERSQYNFSNDFYSCFLLLQGSGEYITEDGEVIPLKEGDLVQRIPGVVHSTRVEPDGQWLEFFFSIGADFFEVEEQLGVLSKIPVKKQAFPSVSINHYNSLIRKLKSSTKNELPMMALEIQQEILYLFGYGVSDDESTSSQSLIQTACDRLSQNLDRDISMEELAEELQVGYESFRKEFKKEVGVSPRKFRNEKRMEQACMLLESGIPIKEIAQMVGYEDTFSFSRQFTKSMNISPGKFRKEDK